MHVDGIDERHLHGERAGANFLVYIYEGGDTPGYPWSVDSYLLTDAHLPEVLRWIGKTVPQDACWSLGVVREPSEPTAESNVKVSWIVGSDVLNNGEMTPEEQQLANDMLGRRHHPDLP